MHIDYSDGWYFLSFYFVKNKTTKKPANKKSDPAEENKSIIVFDAIPFRLALLQ